MALRLQRPLVLLAAFVLTAPHLWAKGLASHPMVSGFERFYSGAKADAFHGGQLLLGELNCVSCHPSTDPSLTRKEAPIVDSVASRVRVSYLRKFLHDPQQVKPGTTMPNLFAGDPKKAEKIEALVHFLAATGGLRQEP